MGRELHGLSKGEKEWKGEIMTRRKRDGRKAEIG